MRLGALLVVVVLLGACGASSQSSDQSFGRGLDNVALQADPFAVPDEVDFAYLESVLNETEKVRGQVRTDVATSGRFTDADERRFEAIFAEPALSFQLNEFRTVVVHQGDDFVPNSQGAIPQIERIVSEDSNCIWFNAYLDDNANVNHDGWPPLLLDVVFTRSDHDRGINPTPWRIAQIAPAAFEVVDDCQDRDDTIMDLGALNL